MKKYLKSDENCRSRVYTVRSVSEFIDVATWVYSSDKVLFRGQTREADWPLIPAVGRRMPGSRVPWRETEILEEFRRESLPYLHIVPSNDWQWLALAQHNGLPTRLLDWTRNSLAALWFAVGKPPVGDQPGIVWALYYDKFGVVTDSTDLETPFAIDRPQVYMPEHVFPFIQAQSGVFTIHSREGSNPGEFVPLEQLEDAGLWLSKIEIPPKYFTSARYHLFKVGISPATLFPGLRGLAEKIRYGNMFSEDELAELGMTAGAG